MIIVPKNLPLIEKLKAEGINITDTIPEGVKPLNILFLNVMPEKEASEAEIYRALEVCNRPINITLIKMSNLFYKNTPQEYMDTYYQDVAEIMEQNQYYDGLIVNGAPLQKFRFEEIIYWTQLKVFFRWADEHVRSSLYICWGGFARLYYSYGIDVIRYDFQWSGVYTHKILNKTTPLIDNSLDEIQVPVSRPWGLPHDEIAAEPDLEIIAEEPKIGPGLVLCKGGKIVFSFAHFEYAPGRLASEYKRDMEKGLNPILPYNYFEDDDPNKAIKYTWGDSCERLYKGWIENYVATKR